MRGKRKDKKESWWKYCSCGYISYKINYVSEK